MDVLLLPLLLKDLDNVIYDQTLSNFLTENKIFVFCLSGLFTRIFIDLPRVLILYQSRHSPSETKSHRFF